MKLTNDDGPPSAASPYIAHFAKVLASPPFNYRVTVVLPSTQRSWIGKAHLIPPSTYEQASGSSNPGSSNEVLSDDIQPTYYQPTNDTTTQSVPTGEYWALVPGTPATCTQLGLFHQQELFPGRPATDIDLVVSGPNYGRNTTAAFALSSGTLGGALEAAVCGRRAIAVSFAYFKRDNPFEVVDEACRHSAAIIEKLAKDWNTPPSQTGEAPTDNTAEIYSINVPLVDGVSRNRTQWTWYVSSSGMLRDRKITETRMLDNKWRNGSLYQAHRDAKDQPVRFKWSPQFKDVWTTIEQSPDGNDGKVIREGITSVTPLRANFEGLYGKGSFIGDLELL